MGSLEGAPLFLSYGKCLLYGVLMDSVDGVVQAAMVPFGLKFPSGIMRAGLGSAGRPIVRCGPQGMADRGDSRWGFTGFVTRASRLRWLSRPMPPPMESPDLLDGTRSGIGCGSGRITRLSCGITDTAAITVPGTLGEKPKAAVRQIDRERVAFFRPQVGGSSDRWNGTCGPVQREVFRQGRQRG